MVGVLDYNVDVKSNKMINVLDYNMNVRSN